MNHYSILKLVVALLLLSGQKSNSQPCSHEALTAKYWQYRENLNKHFVMNDRKQSGCIGNGITRAEEDWTQLNCGSELLHGYGLPATSIWMEPNGAFGMDDRNESSNPFYNPHCADYPADPNIDGTSNGNQQPGVPTKHNFLEYGSETPHQFRCGFGVCLTRHMGTP